MKNITTPADEVGMPNLPTGVGLRRLVVPTSVVGPDAADFVAMTDVRNAIYREINGHDDERISPAELLPHYVSEKYERTLMWLVVADDEIVGRAQVNLPLEQGSHVAFLNIELLRRAWGRGIGSAAHDLLVATARAHGRTVLQGWASHPDAPGDRLSAPTGFGSVPNDHAARFLQSHEYALEQIERNSALDLNDDTFAHLERLLADAQAASAGYRILQWMMPTPTEFVAGYGWMKSRMITDAPAAGIEFDEEVWDAARVAEHDAKYMDAGMTVQVTAAQHVETGELVAFNELVVGNDRTEATHQEDTLVLASHRGHRLGMLVKCAALLSWRSVAPDSPRVLTYNAEENRPMLDINETIGFVPIMYNGAWKRTLAQ
ncbi:GNAT family N-acetyltransferase [Microbacterium terrisoli]|uniref:GNAT family N-acetyltransferase n=1 Tax=Microbacterium terrisoli TaxID=3242192 RepID=UPI002806250F|nr:GNAT family N-acetyltransferase [Microbacterium protaetiae]